MGLVRDGVALGDAAEPTTRSHVGSLPGLVERVLAQAGLAIEDVEGLAVSIGPGSFTGLRIGLAFAKGLAFAGRLPLAVVPTLEALAVVAGVPAGETVCAALDARKREVYAALFRAEAVGPPTRLTPDLALAPEALAARLPVPCALVGDAGEAYGEMLGRRATLLPFATHHPRGSVVARLGWVRLAAGEIADLGAVEPRYLRPPQAQLPHGPSR